MSGGVQCSRECVFGRSGGGTILGIHNFQSALQEFFLFVMCQYSTLAILCYKRKTYVLYPTHISPWNANWNWFKVLNIFSLMVPSIRIGLRPERHHDMMTKHHFLGVKQTIRKSAHSLLYVLNI